MSKCPDSIAPSYFVRETRTYKQWCSVTVCNGCGLRGKYEDQHPVDPCTRCGANQIIEKVGKWVEIPEPRWAFWRRPNGTWLLRSEINNEHD